MTTTVRWPLSHARSSLTSLLILLSVVFPAVGQAQYFGRNKVPYERFRFEVLRSPHWDVHYYQEEATAARDASRMLERWNTRLSSVMAHTLSKRKPVCRGRGTAMAPGFETTLGRTSKNVNKSLK